MFGFLKKEEVSPMTQPLIPPERVTEDVGFLPTSDHDVVNELLNYYADSSNVNGPEYVQNPNSAGFVDSSSNHINFPGSRYISINDSVSFLGNQTVGSDNPIYMGDEYGPSAGIQNGFQITYEKFPEQVLKVQRRQGRESQQRLRPEDSIVSLIIKMQGVGQVMNILAFVTRVNDPSFQLSEIAIGPVQLETQIKERSYGEYELNLNLDSVYEVGGKKVYALAKNKTNEVNLFYLRIVVTFIDGSTCESDTKTFKIVGRAKENGEREQVENSPNVQRSYLPSPNTPGKLKRQRTDTDESNTSSESSPSSGYLSRSIVSPSTYSPSSPHEDGLVKASRIAADYLEARNAEIGSLIVAEPVKTKGGDIAYHFILKNPDDHPEFDEGEIVGLFVNENGGRVLDKLTQKNSLDATLKGVISRSYYLEAYVPPKGVRTETICMFGIVPVKVKGPVQRGDILYASYDSPGVAISSSNLGKMPLISDDTAAIGMAWETVTAYDDELNLMQCLVSITMEVFRGMFEKRMKSLKKNVESDIEKIKLARKKSKKRVFLCVASLATFLILLSILLWQLFMPMSAFRLWLCGQGHIENHSASFYYVPISHRYDLYFAQGDEFTFLKLQKKLDENLHPIPGSGYRYFYNIDRCANFGKSETDPILRRKSVGGPNAFAVDESCQRVYYYSGVYDGWCRYRTAQDITCNPSGIKPIKSTNLNGTGLVHTNKGNSTGPGYC